MFNCFFVDNMTGDGIVQLKRSLMEALQKERYIHAKVPYSWLRVFEKLQQEEKAYVMLDEVLEMCAACGMEGTAEAGMEGEESGCEAGVRETASKRSDAFSL